MRFLLLASFLLALPLFAFAQATDVSKLSGTIFDAYGAAIPGVQITAVAANGKKFQTLTDSDGVYVLTLPYSKYAPSLKFSETTYDLVVEGAPGFQRSETKGFVFVPSYFGKMTLDIGLKVGPCNGCQMIEVPIKKKLQ